MDTDRYISPLSERYASKEMQFIFSEDHKFRTWRKLWIALAETEKELGIDRITDEMIDEMKEHAEDINYDVACFPKHFMSHGDSTDISALSMILPGMKYGTGTVRIELNICEGTVFAVKSTAIYTTCKANTIFQFIRIHLYPAVEVQTYVLESLP